MNLRPRNRSPLALGLATLALVALVGLVLWLGDRSATMPPRTDAQ